MKVIVLYIRKYWKFVLKRYWKSLFITVLATNLFGLGIVAIWNWVVFLYKTPQYQFTWRDLYSLFDILSVIFIPLYLLQQGRRKLISPGETASSAKNIEEAWAREEELPVCITCGKVKTIEKVFAICWNCVNKKGVRSDYE